jgi:NAD(P)-dependent dehydrogenase (short-subunit alcohol dehydrogenase family)
MDLGLDGKGVVVTGGASNIGRALSLGFAAEGARVLIADIDEAQSARVAAAADTVSHRRTDVTDADDTAAAIAHAIDAFGAVDVLVNCAGWTVVRLFLDKPRAVWEREIAVDMWGFINATRAVGEHNVDPG